MESFRAQLGENRAFRTLSLAVQIQLKVPGKRVLVVDDDPRILDLTEQMLSLEGWEIQTTDQRSSVTLEAKTFHPDVILLDVRMPDMDGCEVFDRLKEEPLTAEIPVVFMTARPILAHIPAGYQGEVSGILTKPFSRIQLLEGLKAAFGKSRHDPQALYSSRPAPPPLNDVKIVTAPNRLDAVPAGQNPGDC